MRFSIEEGFDEHECKHTTSNLLEVKSKKQRKESDNSFQSSDRKSSHSFIDIDIESDDIENEDREDQDMQEWKESIKPRNKGLILSGIVEEEDDETRFHE